MISPTNFNIRELAQEITLIDSLYFRNIRVFLSFFFSFFSSKSKNKNFFKKKKLTELANQVWSKKETHDKCPNLMNFIEHTNRIAIWVSYSILNETNVRKRTKIMKNMILLCQVTNLISLI